MRGKRAVLAFDLGASSGRAVLGTYLEGKLRYQEVHRFENLPVERGGALCWDFDTLFSEVQKGICKAGPVDSLAFDTWGVDFGLLDSEGRMLGPPVHYRDARTQGMVEAALAQIPADCLYAYTGNQIMAINTLFQLLAVQKKQPELWARAKTLLFMPDLFAWRLCGEAVCETSIASTSQMLNPDSQVWSLPVLNAFAIPQTLFARPVKSGTVIGTAVCNGGTAKVIAAAGHDTQCAVAALPTNEGNTAFLSCGTWSLLGCELDAPVLTQRSRLLELSNERGANGRINYLKNIIGLWLIQESRRQWRRQGREYSYAELEKQALDAPPFQSFIDPDAPVFASPGDIPLRVQEFCRRTRQPVPSSVGEVMRCIYESLALKYRYALDQLTAATGINFKALHVLGGGAKDKLLCQMAADSCGITVVAGPVEATALGNLIIQLVALRALPDLAAGRRMLAQSEALMQYQPTDKGKWEVAYRTYRNILKE
ncbi:rhamnulokinase [Allofournierella sp.]|uniref:rhamnulokinase n=1 Tax=Allofournierella sp. TaxID=1940256 RepID=UPI003AB1526E